MFLVGPSGLEPPTSCLSGTRSNLLSYEPMWLVSDFVTWLFEAFRFWWRWWDSNPWPPACRAGALPAELHPHLMGFAFLRFFNFGGRFYSSLDWRCRHWAIFPCSFPQSIFATAELNFRVRNGNGWTLCVCNTDYSRTFDPWKLNNNFFPEFLESPSIVICSYYLKTTQYRISSYCTFSIERRWSSRTFRYGYLVTT